MIVLLIILITTTIIINNFSPKKPYNKVVVISFKQLYFYLIRL